MHETDKDKVPGVSIEEALSMFLTVVSPGIPLEEAARSKIFNVLRDKIVRDRPSWARAFAPPEKEQVPKEAEESYAELKRRIARAALQETVPADPEERYFYNRRKEARENRLRKEAEQKEVFRGKALAEALIRRKKNSAKKEKARLTLVKRALAERRRKNAGPQFTPWGLDAVEASDSRGLAPGGLKNSFSVARPRIQQPAPGRMRNDFGKEPEHGASAERYVDAESRDRSSNFEVERLFLEKHQSRQPVREIERESGRESRIPASEFRDAFFADLNLRDRTPQAGETLDADLKQRLGVLRLEEKLAAGRKQRTENRLQHSDYLGELSLEEKPERLDWRSVDQSGTALSMEMSMEENAGQRNVASRDTFRNSFSLSNRISGKKRGLEL